MALALGCPQFESDFVIISDAGTLPLGDSEPDGSSSEAGLDAAPASQDMEATVEVGASSDAHSSTPDGQPSLSDAAGDSQEVETPDGQGTQATDADGGCPTAEVACGSTCVDLTKDSANCGACGRACMSTAAPSYVGTGLTSVIKCIQPGFPCQ
jgi:hypothetical protein